MTAHVTDLVSVLERLEEEAEALVRDGRLFAYARDLTRLVAWLRTQPRTRVLLLAALGAGFMAGVLVLLSTINRPVEPILEEPWPDRNWTDAALYDAMPWNTGQVVRPALSELPP